ncbi:MAG TPA: hypothetical protein VFO58_12440, partial [Vicinamibacterales bacterium]|nr:hypothetical protein [Vicinamibacterales bacterium]
LPVAGRRAFVAVEDVARYRDALGVPLPGGLPRSLLEPVRDAPGDLASRFARSHGPFTSEMLASRYGLGKSIAEAMLARLAESGRLMQGEFRPGGVEREWVDAEVLRRVRSRSLARLRREVEPVPTDALGRFLVSWHGIGSARRGLEALLDAVEQLQGAPLPFSVLERDVLSARVADYEPGMLDTLIAAGEVVWSGVEPLGDRDGRIALYLTDHFARLGPSGSPATIEGRAGDILTYLRSHGASFFGAVHEGTGGGFPGETVDALWDLVWKGLVTNDTLHALRALVGNSAAPARRMRRTAFRSRRQVPPTAEGRWALVHAPGPSRSATEWSSALSHQLLARHGIVTRETAASEAVVGGFSAVYQVLKAMEEAGRVRRGYFVAGLGGAQFAMPAALDLLRSLRDAPGEGTEGVAVRTPQVVMVSATDPVCPYGAIVEWPSAGWADEIAHVTGAKGVTPKGRGPTRTVGSMVILVDGHAAAYLRRGERELLLLGAATEPSRSTMTRETARALVRMSRSRDEGRQGLLIADIDGVAATTHPAARLFLDAGFVASAMGLQLRPGEKRVNM